MSEATTPHPLLKNASTLGEWEDRLGVGAPVDGEAGARECWGCRHGALLNDQHTCGMKNGEWYTRSPASPPSSAGATPTPNLGETGSTLGGATEGEPECGYCCGVGACPKCWGSAAIREAHRRITELEGERDEVAEWRGLHAGEQHRANEAEAALTESRRQYEATRLDAERYRYIRSLAKPTHLLDIEHDSDGVVRFGATDYSGDRTHVATSGKSLDEAIDAALTASRTEPAGGKAPDTERLDWLERKNAQVRVAPILPASCGFSVRDYIDSMIRTEFHPCTAGGEEDGNG